MEAKRLCCGIDVSHTTLDVCDQNNLGDHFHIRVGNNIKGFKKILEHTGADYHFVMEATGVYYIRLAFYLHQQGCALSVINALSLKRYIQMHLAPTEYSSGSHTGQAPDIQTWHFMKG